MNITNTTTYPVSSNAIPDTNETKQNSVQENNIDDINLIKDSAIEPNTLKNMSFEEIQTYLVKNNIDDELDSRANDLFKLQNFADKVDTATYTKMTNALLEEDTVSLASMRYATFPSEEILEENPQLFNALLETSLGIEDTVRSLIFSLDLNKDFGELQSQQNNPDNDTSFSNQSFMDFLLKKLFDIEENSKDGNSLSEKNRIEDYTSLVDNFHKSIKKEEENLSIDILV